jgi:hypothetical protein
MFCAIHQCFNTLLDIVAFYSIPPRRQYPALRRNLCQQTSLPQFQAVLSQDF